MMLYDGLGRPFQNVEFHAVDVNFDEVTLHEIEAIQNRGRHLFAAQRLGMGCATPTARLAEVGSRDRDAARRARKPGLERCDTTVAVECQIAAQQMEECALRFEGKDLPGGLHELGKAHGVHPNFRPGIDDRHSGMQNLGKQLVFSLAKLSIKIERPADIMIIAEEQHGAAPAALEPHRRTFKDGPCVHSSPAESAITNGERRHATVIRA